MRSNSLRTILCSLLLIFGVCDAFCADRYWVGGTGTWNNSSTTHWSASDGGANGASAPTSADNAFITASSGGGTITADSSAVALSVDFTGFAGTFDASGGGIAVSGSVILSVGMTVAAGTSWSLNASGSVNLTSNGNDFKFVVFVGSGTWTLQDAMTASVGVGLISGTLNTNNKNCSWGSFTSDFGVTAALTGGTSVITITGDDATAIFGIAWSIRGSGGFTGTLSSSTIKFTGTDTRTFQGGGKTYGMFQDAGVAPTGNLNFTEANVFSTFQIDAPTGGTTNKTVVFESGQTQAVTSFVCTGTSGHTITLNSDSSPVQFTLSKSSGTVNCDWLILQDSIATGGATWNAGVNSTNSGNNLGWVFGAGAATVFPFAMVAPP